MVFELSKFIGDQVSIGWNANMILMYGFSIAFLFKNRRKWNLLKIFIYSVLLLLVHFLLTIPAATTLGVLMYNPLHVRTIGEHRAIFFLTSIPVIFYAMWNSKLFTIEFNHDEVSKTIIS